MLRSVVLGSVACVLPLFLVALAGAEGPGQKDLDQAVALQLAGPRSMDDLNRIADLCESAIRQKLDESNTRFAKQLLAAMRYQQAKQISRVVQEQRDRRWPLFRQLAARYLEQGLEANSELAEGHLLLAELLALPGPGANPRRAVEAANQAIRLYTGKDKPKHAEALLVRAQLSDSPEQQLADLKQAVQLDPENKDVWRAKAGYHLVQGQADEAVKDFEKLVEIDPSNTTARLVLAETLGELNKQDEANAQIDKVLQDDPKNGAAYALRGRMKIARDQVKEGLADLDKSLELDGDNVAARLLRAEVHLFEDNLKQAREDVDHVLKVRPGLVIGIIMRSRVAAAEERWNDAIGDMQLLLQNNPGNAEWKIQLAAYYNQSERPRKAIEVLSEVLGDDKDNWRALRARGDALLSVGKHAQAIADYNQAVKLRPEDSGILNNLAWVLATSPEEKVRDGNRSIELAKKACEVTNYKAPHILSTLASGYAEIGDFDTAIKWSSKAVELGEEDMKEALQKELESYKQGKPWREKQDVKERSDPDKNLLET